MIYIDINSPKIQRAKEIHYKYWRYIIKKKLNGKLFLEDKPFPNITFVKQVVGIHSDIRNFLNNEESLKKVLIGDPLTLKLLRDKFKSKKHKESVKKILDYEGWDSLSFYNPYNLAKNLDLPTCVYCNRSYTKTVQTDSSKKITRPTFDHWFAKAEYPILAVSFFNLIPSCNICNSSIKGSTKFELLHYFHPYWDHVIADKLDFKFSYDYKDLSNFSFKVIPKNKLSENTINAFKIQEVYSAHEDEIKDLKLIKDTYSDRYIEILYKDILNKTVEKDEIYRLAFGTYIDEAYFDRRPLSKMKKDILAELGIIQ